MTNERWQDEWRPSEPLSDFASRVVARLEVEEGWGAPSLSRRRAVAARRGGPFALVALALVLITGAALGRLSLREKLTPHDLDPGQESTPTTKGRREPVRFQLTTRPAPMEPAAKKLGPSPAIQRPPRAVESAPPLEPPQGPIHFPACHCSSGAVVCSCVD